MALQAVGIEGLIHVFQITEGLSMMGFVPGRIGLVVTVLACLRPGEGCLTLGLRLAQRRHALIVFLDPCVVFRVPLVQARVIGHGLGQGDHLVMPGRDPAPVIKIDVHSPDTHTPRTRLQYQGLADQLRFAVDLILGVDHQHVDVLHGQEALRILQGQGGGHHGQGAVLPGPGETLG